ncbi:biotin transporter BioY [Bosea sp. (in: a-proteobacteria)]|uniref:biotin transporter BioY n=1 Tax=Bosea sp. (in: a-proteobacteria) TaxID=1871050 RepID=UPI00261A6C80|nr:biotin transporter BioY [Bosea sp. (in: a-proteobacteria)]MCO5093288.1 biotin transporter BioY [Bosea sp. (in: a-proteobacteria)]
MTDLALSRPFSPLRLESRSLAWQAGAVIVGSLLLALSSQIKVPMYPVPMTMQTFAVTLIGALYGWRLGAVTVVAWLMQGLIGLPVLAGAGGVAYFVAPTGGYLLAFPFAAALTGWLAQRGWNGNRVGLAFAAMLIGNALCLVIGTAWLSVLIGLPKAIALGAMPFVLGAALKSALAAAALKAFAPRG